MLIFCIPTVMLVITAARQRRQVGRQCAEATLGQYLEARPFLLAFVSLLLPLHYEAKAAISLDLSSPLLS